MASYAIDSAVCGNHVYIWTSFWERNFSAVVLATFMMIYSLNKSETAIVGHIKREISAPCDTFTLGGGVM